MYHWQGRWLVHFLGSWENLTKYQNNLQIIRGYQIPFLNKSKENKELNDMNFSMQEKAKISLEVWNLWKKGSMKQDFPEKERFLSNMFIKKEGWRQQTCNQIKRVTTNTFLFYTKTNKKGTFENGTSRMYIYVCLFLRASKEGWCFGKKNFCTKFYACVLNLHLPHMFKRNPSKSPWPLKKGIVLYDSNLFEQHVIYWQNKEKQERNFNFTRCSHSFISVCGICFKAKVSDERETTTRGVL